MRNKSTRVTRQAGAIILITALSACSGGLFGGDRESRTEQDGVQRDFDSAAQARRAERRETIFDLFDNRDDPNVTLEVNKYIWSAALDVLDFMPIEAADPFTGTIVLGYGVPRGGGQAYRATVFVSDPALDARSLRLSLLDRSGRPVARETQRAVEDAILTRARQLRIADSRL